MGNFRSEPQIKKHNAKGKKGDISFAVSHMCGWRQYMEDAYIAVPQFSQKKYQLYGVFDGHGGAEVSAFVERYFQKELSSNANFKKGNYQEALRQTFLRMDQLIISEKGKEQIIQIQKQMRDKSNGPKYEEPSHAGCTANVILITPDTIYCANAGDSRSVASVNKSTVPLSIDHKPQDQIEIKRIQKAGGTVCYGRVNGNLNLSRALGDMEYKLNSKITPQQQIITGNPDLKKIHNQQIDFIIMGCDGIWQIKSNQDMVQWIAKRLGQRKQPQEIINQLLDELLGKDSGCENGMDNMSAILLKFEN